MFIADIFPAVFGIQNDEDMDIEILLVFLTIGIKYGGVRLLMIYVVIFCYSNRLSYIAILLLHPINPLRCLCS